MQAVGESQGEALLRIVRHGTGVDCTVAAGRRCSAALRSSHGIRCTEKAEVALLGREADRELHLSLPCRVS